jgi:hypothetical protein
VIRSSVLAVCPGCNVTTVAAAAVDRLAAAPTCVTGVPPASATPGYPNSVQAAFEMFVKSRTWYSEPAAPCESPALTDRSRVAQPEPETPPPPGADAEADAPPDDAADEGAAVCDVTVCGVRDVEGAPDATEGEEVADDEACPAVVAGAGDPVDAVQPAAAVTAATAVTMPATRSSSEPEPVINNHPSSVPRSHYDDAVRSAAVGFRLSQSVRGM